MQTLGLVWAAGLLLKGTVLLVFVFLVAALLRRGSAGLRHLVWSGGIVALLALPVVSLTLPWRLPVVATPLLGTALAAAGEPTASPAQPGAPAVTEGLRVRQEPRASVEAVTPPRTTQSRAAAPWRMSSGMLVDLLLALWIAGAALLAVRLGLGMALLRRIVRRATPLQTPDWTRPLLEAADRLGLDRAPRLVMSERLPMPFACGVVTPTIVLPAGATGWTDRRRRAVLCHELAHIRRLDLPVNALAQLACAVYWFHPLVWLAARKLRQEGERACDDLVLGVGTRPSEYADHLLQIVCGAARARTPAVALPMAERREFEGRMLAILERDTRREPPARRHALTLAGFAVALLLPLAALGPAARRPANPPATSADKPADGSARAMERATETPLERGVVTQMTQHRETHVVSREAVRQETAQGGDVQGKGDRKQVTRAAEQAAEQGVRDWKQERSQTADPKVIAALIAALDDSVATVREDAVYALGQLEAKEAAAPLGVRLGREPDAKVRTMIAWALGQLEDPAGIPALAAALRDSSEEVRGRAAWAIGSIEPETAPPELLVALKDAASGVRLRAAWALGQIADPAAVPALTVALKDAAPEVRKAALWALGQMDGAAAQPALIEALKDPDPDVRAAAARALGGGHADPWPWPMPMIR
jgi:beta-lactamase regulating signal transducer with metallopeptidase domain